MDIKATDLYTPASTARNTRGHHCRVDVRKYYFAECIAKQWNDLRAQPSDISSLRI